jgi:4-amino-4-deoxy-L-arabinose transferase-like glycosyltransferase
VEASSARPYPPGRRLGLAGGAPLLALFALALSLRLVCFTGLIASDDLGYSGYAQQIAQGAYRLEAHHYAIRYGVLLPVAALYRCCGVNEWATVAWPLLASALAPVLAALVARQVYGPRAGAIAGLLLATFPVEVRYASILVPEPMLGAALLAAGLLFIRALARPSTALGLGSGALLGLAYLVKEPAVFVALAFILFALLRRQWRLAATLAAGCAVVFASELVWYWMEARDLLFRPHAMAVHEQSAMAVDANQNLAYRLLKFYPRLMLLPNPHYGLHSVLALACAGLALLRRRSALTASLLLWAALPLLYLNFGSSSLSHYWALPAAPRYISLVYAPLFVLGAGLLADWARGGRIPGAAAAALLAVVCAVGVGAALTTRQTGYRTADVQRLRSIAATARRSGQRVCEVWGPSAQAWHETLRLVAPEVLGCAGAVPLRVTPDAAGLPVAAPQPR